MHSYPFLLLVRLQLCDHGVMLVGSGGGGVLHCHLQRSHVLLVQQRRVSLSLQQGIHNFQMSEASSLY